MEKQEKHPSLDRRSFMKAMGLGGAILALGLPGLSSRTLASDGSTPFRLPPLPYSPRALVPYISHATMNFHYGRHHDIYVSNLNRLVSGTSLAGSSLEAIIRQTAGRKDQRGIFNNAAQVWNHTFYWNSMKPQGGGEPSGRLREMIVQSFGDFNTFKEAFAHSALNIFGNGWGWLVQDGKSIRIVQTNNADTPIVAGLNPLITIDVWEHAYYLDHKNMRKDYITIFMNHLLNWDFAEKNLVELW